MSHIATAGLKAELQAGNGVIAVAMVPCPGLLVLSIRRNGAVLRVFTKALGTA
jgi:hypothetical protein